MNKFVCAATLAILGQTTQVFEPQFLQEKQEPTVLDANTGCQFVENYDWYSFIPTNTSQLGEVYKSSDILTQTNAYFQYCVPVTPTQCNGGSSYAAIETLASMDCLLNAKTITGTTVVDDSQN